MVRPILEYGNVIWGPHYVLDQCKLEGVQRHVTKLVPSLRNESYIDRLTVLNLPSLLYRYRRGDLIFLFKLLMTLNLIFIVNLFNVIIISVVNF